MKELRLRFNLHGKHAGTRTDESKTDSLPLHEDEPTKTMIESE